MALTAAQIKSKYSGYAGWNDEAAIVADFNATGGVGKGGTASMTVASAPAPTPITSSTVNSSNVNDYLSQYQKMLFGSSGTGNEVATRTVTPSLGSNPTAAQIKAAFSGYAGWNDEAAIVADYQATKGAGKGGNTSSGTPSDAIFNNVKSMLEPTSERPALLNRAQEYQTMSSDMGLPALNETLNNLKKEQMDKYAELRINVNAETGKPVATNIIAGRVTEQQRNATEELDAIQRQISFVGDQINTANNTISTIMNFKGLDYQDAVKAYDDEFNKNLQTVQLVQGISKDMITIAQQQQQISLANLQVYANAITSGNLNPNSLSSDQKAQLSSLEAQSGLPVGFVSSLQMSPKDRIISTNTVDGVTSVVMSDSSGNLSVKKIGTSTAPASAANQKALEADIAKKMTTDELFAKYGSSIAPNTIIATYNEKSPWGQVKPEDLERLKKNFNVTDSKSTNTLSSTEINKALQAGMAAGLSDDDLKRIKTDSDYANWVLAGGAE